MHAVLVKGGAIQAQGWNLPATDGQFITINPKAPEYCGIHAEVHCIRNSAETEGSTLYIAGVARSNKLLLSMPCEWCMDAIADSGISKVVFHDELGNVHTLRKRAYAQVA